ncbi:MAG: hypothetical protein PHR68_01275 [Candidatus Gracilibacteria bacterium]|nr:hypothetical protein [Candidatus Gracilibacteria bacterium]
MKKFLGIISIIALSFSNYTFGINSVVVSAVVGNINASPVIISVNPSSNPKMIKINNLQDYIIYFRDNEKDIVYYSITAESGATNPISGTINHSDYDSGSGAYINFRYLAPSTAVKAKKITLVLNDGQNATIKELNVYIY